MRGFTNASGGGSSGTLTLKDITFDAGALISYLNLLSETQTNIDAIENFILGLSTTIQTKNLNVDFITSKSITTDKLIINGPNLLYDFDSFEQYYSKTILGSSSNITLAQVLNERAFHGKNALKLTTSATNAYKYINPNEESSNTWLTLSDVGKYIFSFYVTTTSETKVTGSIQLLNSVGAEIVSVPILELAAATGWKRFYYNFNTSVANLMVSIKININQPGTTVYLDALQVEFVEPSVSYPSSFSAGGITVINGDNIITGSIEARSIKTYDLTAANATFENAVIKDAAIDTLTADKLTIGTIDASIITVDNIDAKYIVGETITSDKFLTRSYNLVSNYDSFEGVLGLNVQGTEVNIASAIVVNDRAFHGTKSLKITSTSAAQMTKDIYDQAGRNIWLKAYSGTKFIISLYLTTTSTTPINGNVDIISYDGRVVTSLDIVNLSTTWVRIQKSFDISSILDSINAGYLRINIDTIGAGESVYIDGIQLEDTTNLPLQTLANPFASGNIRISGSNIYAGSITADDAIFSAAAIRSADIQNLSADKISAGSIRTTSANGITIMNGDSEAESYVKLLETGLYIMEPVGLDYKNRVVLGKFQKTVGGVTTDVYGLKVTNDLNQTILDADGLKTEAFSSNIVPSDSILSLDGTKVQEASLPLSKFQSKITADYIETGTITAESGIISSLDAAVITTGRLTSANSVSYMNMDTGEFSFKSGALSYLDTNSALVLQGTGTSSYSGVAGKLSVSISTTEMGFFNGTTRTASISSDNFNIVQGKVEQSLSVGSHKIQKYDAGSGRTLTIFRFIGV